MRKLTATCKNCEKIFNHGLSSLGKYCSNKCQRTYERKIYLQNLKEGLLTDKEIGRPVLYKFLVEEHGDICSICGISQWNDKPIRLWVDHIDGCARNNNWENLRLVCPNCDSQLETSRGKNRGKGRKSLGLTTS